MPSCTDPEPFQQLHAIRPSLRVLYMSGYAKDTLLDTRRLAENAGFIARRSTAESLTRNVGELLDR